MWVKNRRCGNDCATVGLPQEAELGMTHGQLAVRSQLPLGRCLSILQQRECTLQQERRPEARALPDFIRERPA